MDKTEKILGTYCLLAMGAMYATGLVIRLTVLGFSFFFCLALAIHVFLFFLLARTILRKRSSLELIVEGPVPTAGESAAEDSVSGDSDGAAPERVVPNPARKYDQRFTFLGLFLFNRRFRVQVMIAVLILDLAYLPFIFTKLPPSLVVSRLAVHISVWGTLVMAMCFAAAFSDDEEGLKPTFIAFGATSLHLIITFFGHDLFATRSLAIVLAFCSFFPGYGIWRRLSGILLAIFYFVFETLLVNSGLFAYFSELNWRQPLKGAVFAYDYALKIAAIQISDLWGMGREFLAGLEFAQPDLMHLNGLSYLSAWGGDFAVMAYAALNISTLFVLGWFIFKRVKVPLAIIAMPFWCLTLGSQYVTLLCYMVFRTYGLTHGPAFIGSSESGVAIMVLALAVMEMGTGREVLEKENAQSSVREPGRVPGEDSESAPGVPGGSIAEGAGELNPYPLTATDSRRPELDPPRPEGPFVRGHVSRLWVGPK